MMTHGQRLMKDIIIRVKLHRLLQLAMDFKSQKRFMESVSLRCGFLVNPLYIGFITNWL
jgi:hypothetical protein